MSINPSLSFSVSSASSHEVTTYKDTPFLMVRAGMEKSRLNLLGDGVSDTRFNVAGEKVSDANIFRRFIHFFTSVKMSVNGEQVYLNVRSASKRLGITIEQVKQVAASNEISKLTTMAQKRLGILNFLDRYHKHELDYNNVTDRTYYVFMKIHHVIFTDDNYVIGSRFDDEQQNKASQALLSHTRLNALSQYEFIQLNRVEGDNTAKSFQINDCKFVVAKFTKPTTLSDSHIKVDTDFALLNLSYCIVERLFSTVNIKNTTELMLLGDTWVHKYRRFIVLDGEVTSIKYAWNTPTHPNDFYNWAYEISPIEAGSVSRFSAATRPQLNPQFGIDRTKKNNIRLESMRIRFALAQQSSPETVIFGRDITNYTVADVEAAYQRIADIVGNAEEAQGLFEVVQKAYELLLTQATHRANLQALTVNLGLSR